MSRATLAPVLLSVSAMLSFLGITQGCGKDSPVNPPVTVEPGGLRYDEETALTLPRLERICAREKLRPVWRASAREEPLAAYRLTV